VLAVYGEKGESKSLCPGETDCGEFQGAAGKSRREKIRNVCKGCPMLDTKTDAAKKGHKSLERLADRAMDIRRERLTGYPRKETMMTRFQFATLYVIEQMVEQQEIMLKKDQVRGLMLLNGIQPPN
jgi:hypothetical protein